MAGDARSDRDPTGDTGNTGDPAGDDADGPAYLAAVAELEEILGELEGDDPDVDVLTVRVRRAAELIRLCRARIRIARDEVEQVVSELDGNVGAPGDGPPEAPPEEPF